MRLYEDVPTVKRVCAGTVCDAHAGVDGWRRPTSGSLQAMGFQEEHCATLTHDVELRGGGEGGGAVKSLELDFCPECVTGKIVPFLRSIGVSIGYTMH